MRLYVISGEKAKSSYREGTRNPQLLRLLGFCREFDFNTQEEMDAFIRGFELWEHLEDPILWHLTTPQTGDE